MPKVPFWVFILVAILYFTSVRVDTMDIDASQYASMSRELLSSHNWLQLYDHGLNYLDKPPFLMWISALSMRIFGVGNFGYKLPSLLFALWALYATYRLARILYGEVTARMAALVLATCQGMFLMTNDVRCDTILMSWVITAIWLIKEWDVSRKLHYLLLGCAAIGMGMMTKGPIALMVPVFCFMTDWALKRKWIQFFQPTYLLGIVIIGLLLLPMSIGLYQQYDMHPNALVNGQTGVSGLRFFYWSQSFGRITGESPWKNGADMSYLLVNMLWSFLPWVFVLVPAIVANVISLVKQKFRLNEGQEWITTGGFLLAYFSLGSSAYQLPHYIFVAFPLASIITARSVADYLENKTNAGMYRIINPFVVTISAIVLALCLVLIMFIFPSGLLPIIMWSCCAVLWAYLAFNKKLTGKSFLLPVAAMIMANIFLTNFVYYQLLGYQVGCQVGKYIKKEKIPSSDFIYYNMHDPLNSLSFYADELLFGNEDLAFVKTKKYVLTMDEGLDALKKSGAVYDIVKEGQLFKVSELTPTFINPATRQNATRAYYLLKMQ